LQYEVVPGKHSGFHCVYTALRANVTTVSSNILFIPGKRSMSQRIPNILSIAGIDPSGGAGILADIKAMSALGGYGCAVVAALTAQNTQAVTAIHPVPHEFVVQQIDTLFADVQIDAV